MRKVLSLVAMIAAFALIVGLGVTAFAKGSDPSTAVPTVNSTDDPSGSPSTGGDVKGNCDEPEHANDPECQGVTPMPEDATDDGSVEDVDQGDVEDADQGNVEDSDEGDVEDSDEGDVEDSDEGDLEDSDEGDVEDGDEDNSGSSDDSGTGSDDSGTGSDGS